MKNPEQPDYKRIYQDIIEQKHPSKKEACKKLLSKKTLSRLDIITIDKMIFGEVIENRKHRSYDKKAVFEILEYQKKNRLNNMQLARHFKLSRNTITKWKKTFIV